MAPASTDCESLVERDVSSRTRSAIVLDATARSGGGGTRWIPPSPIALSWSRWSSRLAFGPIWSAKAKQHLETPFGGDGETVDIALATTNGRRQGQSSDQVPVLQIVTELCPPVRCLAPPNCRQFQGQKRSVMECLSSARTSAFLIEFLAIAAGCAFGRGSWRLEKSRWRSFGYGLLLMPSMMVILLAWSVRRMVHRDRIKRYKVQ